MNKSATTCSLFKTLHDEAAHEELLDYFSSLEARENRTLPDEYFTLATEIVKGSNEGYFINCYAVIREQENPAKKPTFSKWDLGLFRCNSDGEDAKIAIGRLAVSLHDIFLRLE